MKNLLTIAGFDPSSGAGVTKDLHVFFSLGAHGVCVPTCIVNQGPQGVTDLFPIPAEQLSAMLTTVREEIAIHGIKIGAALDGERVGIIADFIASMGRPIPIVIDPVMAAKNGTVLLDDSGAKGMVEHLFPVATVITPNVDEAAAISGVTINDISHARSAAEALQRLGPKAVVLKGGHLPGDPVDILFHGGRFTEWPKKRVGREIHGTGCVFSSLLLFFLAGGYTLGEAFAAAQGHMERLINGSYRINERGYYYTPAALFSPPGDMAGNS